MKKSVLILLLGMSILAVRAQSVDSVYMIAKVKFKMRDMDLAMENAEKALALDPLHHEALLLKGLILYESGELDESLKWIGKSIESYDRFGEAYYERGLILYYEDRVEEAAEDFVKAANIRINNPDYAYYEGISLLETGQTYEGCKAIKRAGRLGSDENIEKIEEKYDCDNVEKPESEKLGNKLKNLFKSGDDE